MAESPTYLEVIKECAQIEQYIAEEVVMLDYITSALADVKRYLRNIRGIEWATVYNSDTEDYFKDTEDNENNKDQLLKAIRLMTIAIIYKDNAQEATESIWWDLYKEYREEAEQLIYTAKFDIDSDSSGGITSDEESLISQSFFRR